MKPLLHWHVVSEMAARRCLWSAACVLLAACTGLVLKMLPEFGVWTSRGMVSGLALAWVVVGTQFPRMIVRA
jgi:hypothetical protein